MKAIIQFSWGEKIGEKGEIWHTPLLRRAHLRGGRDGVISTEDAMWGQENNIFFLSFQ